MSGFEDISFDWKGDKYKIPSNKVLGAIARVEDIITLTELQRHSEKGGVPVAKLSMAYGVLLRYAGARITDGEIFEGMFKNEASVAQSIVSLISMMVPPSVLKEVNKEQKSGNLIAAAAAETARNSLKKPTKLRSPTGK